MRIVTPAAVIAVLFAGTAGAVERDRATAPLTVSPMAMPRSPAMTAACPTFSWTSVEGATGYELVVYRLDAKMEGAAAPARTPVVRRSLPAGASSWTLDTGCLDASARYAWSVRASVGDDNGAWSRLARFAVRREIDPALFDAVVAQLHAQDGAAADARNQQGFEDGSEPELHAASVVAESLATGSAAVRGELAATSGETYGVVGVSNSIAGAGVGAQGAAGGPDLVLDGTSEGLADTLLSQSSLDRPSGSNTAFDFKNSGAGSMSVSVDGAQVIDTAHLSLITATGPLSALAVTGNTTLGDSTADKLTLLGSIQSATPLRFEGTTVNGNSTVFQITDPTAPRTATFPDLSGEVSLLGQTVDGGEINDLTRTVNLPITALFNCTDSKFFDFSNGADNDPDFATGPTLQWDSDDSDAACTSVAVPPEAVGSPTVRLVVVGSNGASDDWVATCVYRTPGSNTGTLCGVSGGTSCNPSNSSIYACDFAITGPVAGDAISLQFNRTAGLGTASLMSAELRYLANQ